MRSLPPLAPDFETFGRAYRAGRPQVVVVELIADLDTTVSVFLKIAGDAPYSFLLESVEGGEVRGRYSAIGLRPDLIWRARRSEVEINRRALDDPDGAFEPVDLAPMESLRAIWWESRIELPESVPPIAAGIFGCLGYDMVRHMERLPDENADALGLPDAIMIRPTVVAVFDTIADKLILVTPVWPDPTVDARTAYDRARARLSRVVEDVDRPIAREAGGGVETQDLGPVEPISNMTPDAYMEIVRRAKEYVLAGDAFQIVLSQRFTLPFTLPHFALYRALRRLNPSPFLFYLNFGSYSLVGSSPEILVRLRGSEVTIRPIAGTRRRGATLAEDQALAEELSADPKEQAEHLMLLDLGRNDVGRVAKIGSVRVTDSFVVERYSHVMHLVSNVVGEIAEDKDAIDALVGGFPAGTLSGAPKVRAMEIIDELEVTRRGLYAGAVGYFGAGGDMDTCIILRTAVLEGERMHVQAGAGIVADSDPASEHQECVNKAMALVRAAEEARRYAHDNQTEGVAASAPGY